MYALYEHWEGLQPAKVTYVNLFLEFNPGRLNLSEVVDCEGTPRNEFIESSALRSRKYRV